MTNDYIEIVPTYEIIKYLQLNKNEIKSLIY